MLTRLDSITLDFVLAVIITDCLVGFFVWYEVIYNVGDTRLETAIGVGSGIAISLAVTIVIFAHWEGVRVISERYKRIRFEEGRKLGIKEGKELGLEEGKELGRREATKEQRKRLEELLLQSGIELTPEDQEKLFGERDSQSG